MPTNESPISPSISARGTRAATESRTTQSMPAGADQGLGDLERLLAGVRLADEELVDVHAAGSGVGRIEGVLDIDEGGDAAAGLGLGDDVLADRRLARRLRAEDLGDPAARDPTDAECEVEGDRARRDHVDRHDRGRPELHDRAGPELLLDRLDRRGNGLAALRLGPVRRSIRGAIAAVALVRRPLSGQRHGFVTLLSIRRCTDKSRSRAGPRAVNPRRSLPR